MANYLLPITKITNVTAYANEMFAAKSDLTNYSMEEILLLDYKTFVFNDQVWGIGVAETFDPNHILDRIDKLLGTMADEKKKSQLAGILFCIIDIAKMKNSMIILGESEDTVIKNAFAVDIKDRIADLGSKVSRKKDIVPTLELYFKSIKKASAHRDVQDAKTFVLTDKGYFRSK